MTARQLLVEAALQHARFTVLSKAFDDAWAVLASAYEDDSEQAEKVRRELATIIIGFAAHDHIDAEGISKAALALLAPGSAPSNAADAAPDSARTETIAKLRPPASSKKRGR